MHRVQTEPDKVWPQFFAQTHIFLRRRCLDKGLKGTIWNWACHSINETKLTVPLKVFVSKSEFVSASNWNSYWDMHINIFNLSAKIN